MVCDRCKSTVKNLVHKHNGAILNLQLGRVELEVPDDFDEKAFAEDLKGNGFQLILNPEERLVESIKINLIKLLHQPSLSGAISSFLSEQLHKDYSVLSKVFKKIEGETIEKYFIKIKIEKVKELIQMQKLSFSEIAYQLGYSSISHLSGQFKSHTGMTMSEYQKSGHWNRRSIDKIL